MTQHVTSKSNTKELYVNIGKRLKQIRLNKGYTQEEFSEIIEISPAYYGKNRTRLPRIIFRKVNLTS